jgi:phage terminase large subunit-like protein
MGDRAALLALLNEKARREIVYRYKKFHLGLYDWQNKFIEATKKYPQVALIAGNRTGKTYTGTYIDAIHLLGDYPEDWKGHKFDHAPLVWCLGYSGEKTRDLLQTPLFGRRVGNTWEGGLIPPERIVGQQPMTGTSNAMRTVFVRHSSGEIAKVQFWSYSQGQHALMGDSVDWFHIDEEPKDRDIFPQVLTRTATGDCGRGGRGILTFTPENGRTELVLGFLETPSSGQFCMTVGWDDSPHLTEEVKTTLLESFPEHQRDMRSKGIPMLGHGRIYDLAEEIITCDSFEIPDHWRIINGMDFGWDHPQAHIQLAIDPDNDVIYLTRAWKERQKLAIEAWGAVKAWAAHYPTAWPLDGLQTEKGSGKQQKAHYAEAGWTMIGQHAQWPDGSNGVNAGLMELLHLMRVGKFKVFRGLRAFLDEFLQYHRDSKGNIVKTGDDCLDAVRYAYMMRRFAVVKKEPENIQINQFNMGSVNYWNKR